MILSKLGLKYKISIAILVLYLSLLISTPFQSSIQPITNTNITIVPESLSIVNAQTVYQATNTTLTIYVGHPNERVYILASGHIQLETVNNIKIDVDGIPYTMFNWHPLTDDSQLTTTGVIIPYLGGPNGIALSPGPHTIVIEAAHTSQAYYAWMLLSVFGVYPTDSTSVITMTSTTQTTTTTT